MSKNKQIHLTNFQKEQIAEQIATIMFNFWRKKINRDNQMVILESGQLWEEACPDDKMTV